jgi:hypothetical protein
MAEAAMNKQPEDTTPAQRAGQQAGGNDPQAEYGDDGSAGGWPPSGAHNGPAGEEEILAAIFDRLAEAASAHDGEPTGDTSGDELGSAPSGEVPAAGDRLPINSWHRLTGRPQIPAWPARLQGHHGRSSP